MTISELLKEQLEVCRSKLKTLFINTDFHEETYGVTDIFPYFITPNFCQKKNLRIRKKLLVPNIWIVYNIGWTKISLFGNQNFGLGNFFSFLWFITMILRIQKICSENTAGICFITSGPVLNGVNRMILNFLPKYLMWISEEEWKIGNYLKMFGKNCFFGSGFGFAQSNMYRSFLLKGNW
jgi:hypothetical protein